MRNSLISIAILLLYFNGLLAQTSSIDSTWIDQLEAVVVTAQYAPKSEQNAVYKVKVINQQTIEAKGANNLRELLSQELSLDLTQNAVFGTSMEMQGISRENIKILIDGVPVIGRLNGIIDLNQINLNNIERVEVIEGPVSVFYGTDAMGGIINLITKKNQQKKLEAAVSTYYESINANNVNAHLGYKVGSFLVQANGGYYHFNGLKTVESLRDLNWEERQQQFGDLMLSKDIGTLKLSYNGHFSNEKLISKGEKNSRGKIKDKDYYTSRIDNTLNLQGKILDNKHLNASLSYLDYQRYHNTFNIDTTTFESVPSTVDNKDDNIVKYNYSGLKVDFGKSEKVDQWNYMLGADVNKEATKGVRILDKKQDVLNVALFGSLNYKLTQTIELQAGVRYTWNSSFGSLFSPAFNTKIKLGDRSTLRFSYARGFRAPSLKELFLDFHISAGPFTYIISGNENLNVEQSHSLNVQYSFNTQLGKSQVLVVEPAVFYNDITDLITLSTLVDFKRHYINIDQFKSLGGKVDFTYIPNQAIVLKTGFGTIGRYNKFAENFDSNELLYTPEFSFSFKYFAEQLDLNFDLYYKYSGERTGFYIDNDTEKLVKTIRDAFHTMNTSVSKSFFNQKLNTQLGIKNLFDVKDVETVNLAGEAHSRDLQLWGRSFFVKATIKL